MGCGHEREALRWIQGLSLSVKSRNYTQGEGEEDADTAQVLDG